MALVPRPQRVTATAGRSVALVAAGSGHSVVLLSDSGAVLTFGRNDNGQLGVAE